jgi:uncharacterized protein YdaU (DUF1376 family)
MNRLGYTWYPKDFISDPDVMMMSSSQRGVYRDLIDLAYMNDNKIKYNLMQLSKYCNASEQEISEVLALKGEKIGEFWAIPSCDKRIAKSQANRENGGKGGRPKKPKQNPTNNPTETQTITQTEPNSKGKEKEKEKENINLNKTEEEYKPPTPQKGGSFNFLSELLNLGVEQRVAEDWMKVRRTKKATNTETAFNKIKSQMEKSGKVANECIQIAVEKDWKGFEASWMQNINNPFAISSQGKPSKTEHVHVQEKLTNKDWVDPDNL